MASVLRHVHAPSSPNVVFVITLAVLLAAAVYVILSVIDLLNAAGFNWPARS